jgi:hypothetical protein
VFVYIVRKTLVCESSLIVPIEGAVLFELATGGWFSPCTPVSSTNKTDRHDITGILLKVTLSTILHI